MTPTPSTFNVQRSTFNFQVRTGEPAALVSSLVIQMSLCRRCAPNLNVESCTLSVERSGPFPSVAIFGPLSLCRFVVDCQEFDKVGDKVKRQSGKVLITEY